MTDELQPAGRAARELWSLMPEHHRVRDRETGGDLRQLIEAVGVVLDEIRGTLDQRLSEVAPGGRHPVLLDPEDPDEIQRIPQEWLLPYYADLLDVRMVSSDPDAQRRELASAVVWRKGTGTMWVAEDAARAIAGTDVVLAEGRSMIVVTPRVDRQELPELAFTDTPLLPADTELRRQPNAAARHPSLPTGTVDVHHTDRAVATTEAHPRARRRSNPNGHDIIWRHLDVRGVPCFPGTHEDPVARTPDSRSPGQRQGLAHPARVVAYLAPAGGFFPPPSRAAPAATPDGAPVPAPAAILFNTPGLHELSDIEIASLTVTDGQVWCRGVTVHGKVDLHSPKVHRLEDVTVIGGPVKLADGARLEALRSALPDVQLADHGPANTGELEPDRSLPGPTEPRDVLVARECLFGSATAGAASAIQAAGRVTLDSCTILGDLEAAALRASETILTGALRLSARDAGCVRFSRIPDDAPPRLDQHACTTQPALLEPALDCSAWGNTTPAAWAQPGCGVLDRDCSAAILLGAEDGGELGAFHALRTASLPAAIARKVSELLPVGMEPVVVLDRRLWAQPPTVHQP